MAFDNQFLENILKKSRKENLNKSLSQALQGIALHAILANRTRNIKSITKEFIEYWMTYNSRAWRSSQARASLNIHISSRGKKVPIYISLGNIEKNIRQNLQ